MHHLHSLDLLHRDLKSPNLLVDELYKVKVRLAHRDVHACAVHGSPMSDMFIP